MRQVLPVSFYDVCERVRNKVGDAWCALFDQGRDVKKRCIVEKKDGTYLPAFKNDIDKVIERAIDKGITKMFLPNIDRDSIKSMKKLALKYPENCFPMMGLHPTSVEEEFENDLTLIKDELNFGMN